MPMRETRPLRWSFIGTLTGGILILVASISAALVTRGWVGVYPMPFSPMMGWTMMMGVDAAWMGGVGLLAGAAVILAAFFLRARPDQAELWGIVAIVGGATSLVAMGGYLLGAALAMVGGAMAIAAGGPRARARHAG